MTVESKREQAVLDARMEYGHLMTTYVSLANMVWIGFGAFFTINTLLATGLGVSYSQAAATADQQFIGLVRTLIPATGMFISVTAIRAAMEIKRFQRLAIARGRQLETLLNARMFAGMVTSKFPIWTAIGSLFFLRSGQRPSTPV